MTNRKGFLSLSTMIMVTVIGGGLLTFLALDQVMNFFQLVMNYLYYVLITVIFISLGGVYILRSYRDSIDQQYEFAYPALIIVFFIVGIIAGPLLGTILADYKATIGVNVEEGFGGYGQPAIKNAKVESIQNQGPDIFGARPQCTIGFCEAWKAEIQVWCGGDSVGTRTVSGTGSGYVTADINVPTDASCNYEVRPKRNLDGASYTGSFTTG